MPASRRIAAPLAVLMLAIAVVDYRRMIIPDELNALALIAGLIAAGVGTEAVPAIAILQALVRTSLMFALFLAFRAGYATLRGVEGICERRRRRTCASSSLGAQRGGLMVEGTRPLVEC